MEASSLPGDERQLNICMIERGSYNKFPTKIPGVLCEFMREEEYVTYINQVNKVAYTSKKLFFFLVIALVCLPFLLPLGVIPTPGVNLSVVVTLIWSVLFVLLIIYACVSKCLDKTKEKTEAAIEQINQKLRPRGIKWVYVLETKDSPGYIDVFLLNPISEKGSAYETSTQFSYSSLNNNNNTNIGNSYIISNTNDTPSFKLQTYPPSSVPTSYVPPSLDPTPSAPPLSYS